MSETVVGVATTAFPSKDLSITSFRRDGTGRVERLMAREYRVDLVFIKPVRSLQAALHPGRPRGRPVILAITPR